MKGACLPDPNVARIIVKSVNFANEAAEKRHRQIRFVPVQTFPSRRTNLCFAMNLRPANSADNSAFDFSKHRRSIFARIISFAPTDCCKAAQVQLTRRVSKQIFLRICQNAWPPQKRLAEN